MKDKQRSRRPVWKVSCCFEGCTSSRSLACHTMSGRAGIRIAATLIRICPMNVTDKAMSPGTNWRGTQMMINLVQEWFTRWREGRTGFPWIDALMRQLKHDGWIHQYISPSNLFDPSLGPTSQSILIQAMACMYLLLLSNLSSLLSHRISQERRSHRCFGTILLSGTSQISRQIHIRTVAGIRR